MKLIIFAGGIGTRLWPLSRENSPKQFDKIFNGKSTIQLAVGRIAPVFGLENVYIQTVASYKKIIKEQIPEIAETNIIIEPERRNLAPAVCLAMIELKKTGYNGPVTLLWADHLMERVNEFTDALKMGEKLILENPNRFIFLGERPRFANNNLGWLKIGEAAGRLDAVDYYNFDGWKYKPEASICSQMFKSGEYFWNPGYFITSVEFLIEQYKNLAPEIYDKVISGNYEQAPKIHFDEAIIEKVDLKNAVVLKTDMGWSDPGTLYALKEALQKEPSANVIHGLASLLDTDDCLVYNLEENKLVAGIGLRGVVIVNTPDAIIIVPKDEVVNITKLIAQMKEQGLEKYL
jgi:mannose-1-phosphate guanylyltransferase